MSAKGLNAWFEEGVCHRAQGPAVVHEGAEYWYRSGRLHRIEGPAILDGFTYSWFHEGKRVSEDEAWALYFQSEVGIGGDDADAVEYLRDGRELNPDGTFPAVDPVEAQVALKLYRDGGSHWKPERGRLDTASVDRPEPLGTSAPMHPSVLLRDQEGGHASVTYDTERVRGHIARASAHHCLPRVGSGERHAVGWRVSRREVIKSLVLLDPASLMWGDPAVAAHQVVTSIDWGNVESSASTFGGVAYRVATITEAYDSAQALFAADGVPQGWPGNVVPQPSATIEHPVERAFEFAARLIASGVDHAVALAWSLWMLHADGYDVRDLTLGLGPEDRCGPSAQAEPSARGTNASRLAVSVVSAYFAAALSDLRERRDGTRFMELVTRAYCRP